MDVNVDVDGVDSGADSADTVFLPAIASIFTATTLYNRRRRQPLSPSDPPSAESPLLPDPVVAKTPDENGYFRSVENSRTVQSRFLVRFPFLIEIWYWLLIYWVRYTCGTVIVG